MTLPDRSIEKRSRTPWLLFVGLLAVAVGVVVVFAGGREPPATKPAKPLGAPPPAPDSTAVQDSAATAPDSTPAPVPAPPAIRPDTPPADSTGQPDTGRRAPIGDPAALPRPGVTLPRPGSDTGARP